MSSKKTDALQKWTQEWALLEMLATLAIECISPLRNVEPRPAVLIGEVDVQVIVSNHFVLGIVIELPTKQHDALLFLHTHPQRSDGSDFEDL